MGNVPYEKIINRIGHIANGDRQQSYFLKKQMLQPTQSMIQQSLEFIINAKPSTYKSFHKFDKYLYPITLYLNQKQYIYESIQKLIQQNYQVLQKSAMLVLKTYEQFLSKVTPANITFFHFMRQSDIYKNYIIVKYILCMGNIRKKQKISIFDNIPMFELLKLFQNGMNWLYNLVHYRCSIIYFDNAAIIQLIQENFMLICGFLANTSINTIKSIHKQQRKQIINQFLYISLFLLSQLIKHDFTKNQYFYDLIAKFLLKVLKQAQDIEIYLFAPSYWYNDIFGHIKSPKLHQILLLFSLQIVQIALKKTKNDLKITITEVLYGHLAFQLIKMYKTTNHGKIQNYLLLLLSLMNEKNICRAFLIGVSHFTHIKNRQLSEYLYKNSKKGYCVQSNFITIQLTRSNWQLCEDRLLFPFLYCAIQKRIYSLLQKTLWKLMVKFNNHQMATKKEIDQLDDNYFLTDQVFISSDHNIQHEQEEIKTLQSLIRFI